MCPKTEKGPSEHHAEPWRRHVSTCGSRFSGSEVVSHKVDFFLKCIFQQPARCGSVVGKKEKPWRIRLTEQLRNLFVDNASSDYIPVVESMRRLGVSRQTIWQRVKRGELDALHVRQGQRKGLRIKVVDRNSRLFE